MKEGLLDFVVPNIYNEQQMNADFPFEWLVELARGRTAQVHYGPRFANGKPEAHPLPNEACRREPHNYAPTRAHLREEALNGAMSRAEEAVISWVQEQNPVHRCERFQNVLETFAYRGVRKELAVTEWAILSQDWLFFVR